MKIFETDDKTVKFLCGSSLAVLLIGLLIRFILSPFLTYPFDVEHWAVIIQNINNGNGLYGLSGYFYTPVWGYILGFETFFLDSFGNLDVMGERFVNILGIEGLEFRFYTATTTTPLFNFLMKFPIIVADVITGYLLWELVIEKTSSKKKADLAFALWFLCPVVVYMSGVQVQFDCMSAMFALLTILLARKRMYLPAGAMLMIAVLIKLFPAFLLLPLVAYVWNREGGGRKAFTGVLLGAVGAMAALVVVYLPNLMDGTVIDSLSFIIGRGTESAMSAKLYVALMAVVSFATMIFVSRNVLRAAPESLDDCFLLSCTASLAAASLISTGPQYCIVYLPLFAYLAATTGNKAYRRMFIAVGVLSALIAFGNNSLSILTSSAEYFGFPDPQWVVDAMTAMEACGWSLILIIVQALQMISLFITFIIILGDCVDNKDAFGMKYVTMLKRKIGGDAVGQE